MKSILSLALIFALSLTSSAATINKVRQARGTTYTVTTVESNGATTTMTSDLNGIVSASFYPSDDRFLTSASIYNRALYQPEPTRDAAVATPPAQSPRPTQQPAQPSQAGQPSKKDEPQKDRFTLIELE